MAYYGWSSGTELYHYGIPGQKWGQRRYQNPDGSLTEEGRARYGRIANRHYAAGRALSGYAKRHSGTRLGNLASKAAKRQVAIGNSYRSSKTQNARDKKIQKALKIGAAAAGAAALGYGAYRYATNPQRASNRALDNMATRSKIAFGSKLNAGDKLRVAGWKTRAGLHNAGMATKAGLKKAGNNISTSIKNAPGNIKRKGKELSAYAEAMYRGNVPYKTQAKIHNIGYDAGRAGRAIGRGVSNVGGAIGRVASRAGSAIGRGASRAGSATGNAVRTGISNVNRKSALRSYTRKQRRRK